MESPFSSGVVSMARNCKAALALARRGQWTLDQFDLWLDLVISNSATRIKQLEKERDDPMMLGNIYFGEEVNSA